MFFAEAGVDPSRLETCYVELRSAFHMPQEAITDPILADDALKRWSKLNEAACDAALRLGDPSSTGLPKKSVVDARSESCSDANK